MRETTPTDYGFGLLADSLHLIGGVAASTSRHPCIATIHNPSSALLDSALVPI